MNDTGQRIYALPMMVGNYSSHKDADYFRTHLRKVDHKEDIPAGMYACRAVAYRCPECGYRTVKLTVFLPVRDQEKFEEIVCFENGELDEFLSEV